MNKPDEVYMFPYDPVSSTEGILSKIPDGTTLARGPPLRRVSVEEPKKASSASPKKQKKGHPKDKPKRPLSAYNLFFQHQRGQILKATPERKEGKPRRSHGKIGFADLARSIAANWKSIDPETRAHFDALAAEDKVRYTKEMKAWKTKQAAATGDTAVASVASVSTAPEESESSDFAEAADFEPIPLIGVPATDQPPSFLITDSSFDEEEEVNTDHLWFDANPQSQGLLQSPPVIDRLPIQAQSVAQLSSDLDDDCKTLLRSIFHF